MALSIFIYEDVFICSYKVIDTVLYPMPWKIQPIRVQDYRCIFCGIQRVVFTRPSRHYLRDKTMLYNMDSSLVSNLLIKIINSYVSFKIIPIISDHFRPFPNTSEDFPKIFENRKNALKMVLNNFLIYIIQPILVTQPISTQLALIIDH